MNVDQIMEAIGKAAGTINSMSDMLFADNSNFSAENIKVALDSAKQSGTGEFTKIKNAFLTAIVQTKKELENSMSVIKMAMEHSNNPSLGTVYEKGNRCLNHYNELTQLIENY